MIPDIDAISKMVVYMLYFTFLAHASAWSSMQVVQKVSDMHKPAVHHVSLRQSIPICS